MASSPATAQTPSAELRSPLAQRYLAPEAPSSAPSAAGARTVGSGDGPHARLFPCDDAPGGRCGVVKARLDRSQPGGAKIPIFFEYYRHRRPGPTDEAIIATGGGPGFSITQDFLSEHLRGIFDPLLGTRDLIFLDQRGVGRSRAIDCRRLQDGSEDILADVEACGEQLGDASSHYGSHDVARDIDRVRRALGIEQLDFYGGSNAGLDIQAYAVRFPEHLRSAVLDSPVSHEYDVYGGTYLDAAMRSIGLLCERSESCSADHADALDDVAWLAERLRDEPVDGVGRDATGAPHTLHVTEGFLLWRILQTDAGDFASFSEIAAAADALQAGDEAPLLRLAAEGDGPLFPDEGNPMNFSLGDNFARYCTDLAQYFPWDTGDSIAERQAQWEAARDALPPDSFAPFSVDGWLAPFPISPISPDACIAWPAPEHEVVAPVPAGADLPGDVPALLMTGDLEFGTPTSEVSALADSWPNSEFIEFANGGHVALVTPRFECGAPIVLDFIKELELGDTSCTDDLAPLQYPALGRYVVTAEEAREAEVDPAGVDESGALDRQVATVAANTVTDAIRRIFIEGTPGRGLRGGRFSANFTNQGLESRLRNVRFAEDVIVSGPVDYPFGSESIDAEVEVDGPGDEDGTLRIKGVWFAFRSTATELRIRGSIDGRQLALRVPAT